MDSCITVLLLVVATLVTVTASGSTTSCEHQQLILSSQNDGYITSPNYPEHYSSQSCFTWTFYGTPGTQISIRLLDIDIPSYTDTCSHDFLMIGPINEHRYCGNIHSRRYKIYKAQLTNLQRRLYVVFNSTNVDSKGRGFNLHYQFRNIFVSFADNTTTNTVSTTTTATTGDSWGSELYNSAPNCNFVFTSRKGSISTNDTVLNCLRNTGRATWLIYSLNPGEANINYRLHFELCVLPHPANLKLYDGYSNTYRALNYFANPCSGYFISSKHAFFIEYWMHSTQLLPTFQIEFTSVRTIEASVTEIPQKRNTTAVDIPIHNFPDRCIFYLSRHSGEIRSDGLISTMHDTGYCSWLLYTQVTDGDPIMYTLTFEKFQLSPNSIFTVYDGGDTTAPTLGTYSSIMSYFSVTSSQNIIFMLYSPGTSYPPSPNLDVFTIKYNAYVRCAQGYEPCGYDEFSCFRDDNRCDGVWHCPLHGGDERGCSGECTTDFSCDIRGPNCYTEADRCNGKGTCSNYKDELGCNEEKCSPDKGLYLCRNGRCIYEKWRCDRMNDCFDNSDEEDCSVMSSAWIIVSAVIGVLMCSLLLVIAAGCVCKMYHLRARQLRGGPRHETPLSRQLADMFYHRAPPPPYHEAMLTSRPFDEAYLELLGHTEQQLEPSDINSEQNSNPAPPRERSQINNRQRSRRCHHNQRRHNQSSRFRSDTDRLAEVDNLPLLLEVFEDGVHRQESSSAGSANNSELPPYSECDHPITAESFCSDTEDESSESETWPAGIDNTGYVGDTDGVDGEPVIQLAVIPSSTIRSIDVTSVTSGLCLRNYNRVRTDENRSFDNVSEEDDNDKDIESASTSVSVDSSRIVDEEDNKIHQQHMTVIDEDSDSECILNENNVEDVCDDDDDNTDSDTACILGHA